MKQQRSKLNQSGFTIIELLIATVVFSTILLLLSVGLIQVARLYYKGITTSRTQQTTRAIIDTVSRDIQFSGGTAPVTVNGPDVQGRYYFCVNNTRYTYVMNTQLVDGSPGSGQANHVMVKDSVGSCSAPANLASPGNGAVELVGTNMRLSKLDVVGPTNNVYTLSLRVVSGDSDLLCSPSWAGDCDQTTLSTHLNNNDIICKNFSSGTQFCAVSELQTVVQKRI